MSARVQSLAHVRTRSVLSVPTMRRTPPTIHFLAASDAATSVSSHTHHRGFSGRSYSGGRGQFVSGDAHFQSVRDANLGFRRGQPNPPYNPSPSHPPAPQHHYHNPQFRHPPSQFRQPHHGPPFRPPQNFRPRPPDYRNWEFALTPPPLPPHTERFKVLSYNILADYLALGHRHKLYFHIPQHMLDWQWRKRRLIFELGLWSADIMCLQEVDRFQELAEELKLKGYSGIWKMRTGNAVDGCAIFWQTSRFKLLYEESIEYNKLGLRDNVAQVCVLEFINQNGSPQSSLTGNRKVVVCNIHVLYNPNRGEIKLGQVRVLLDKAKAVSKFWDGAPVVICGDFNCTPKSPLYNFISEQKLDLSGIDRDKVSGQASAIIRAPKFYSPNSSERHAKDPGSVRVTSIEAGKEGSTEQLDVQNLDTESISLENQYTQTVLNMPVKSSTNVACGKESDTYARKDTQETADDPYKIFCEAGSIKEESDPSYSEGRLPIGHKSGEIHDVAPLTLSAPEAVSSDITELGIDQHISDSVSTSNKELLIENANLHVPEGNKNVDFDCSPTSLQEVDQSFQVNIDLESTDLGNTGISSAKPSSQTSVSSAFEVPHTEYNESPSCEVIANDPKNSSSTSFLVDKSHHLSNIDFPLDEQLEKSFLDEIDKSIISSENVVEDGSTFISALHNNKGGVDLDLGPSEKSDLAKSYQFEELDSASINLLLPVESNEVENDFSPSQTSKSIDAEESTYNPSLWTPMEIETATGNAECPFLKHPLSLRSTYTEAKDCSATRDPHGEPLVTSYNRCFLGTVDYIWRSEGVQTVRVLAPMPKHAMEWTCGFPTKKWGSDHIALVSELAFLKDGADISTNLT
ncbi:hypothetical protein RJT34_16514 [Clitoria ternatea]|uniref:Endonuclease/exonuclease/phosphatase domain-containing protein n=1 Tax=Clitoria ternatea TaxID=43366 RepID=A0AAN9PDR5_CLITE